MGATAGCPGFFDLRRQPDVGFLFRGTLALLASDPEEHDVAILDPVLAPFDAQLSRGTKRLHRTRCDELVDRSHLRADEMLFEICVDLAGRNWRRRVAFAWPRAHLGLTGGEIGDEASGLPHGSRDPTKTRLVDAITRAHLRLLTGFELAQLGFEPRRQNDRRRMLAVRKFADLRR